MVSGAARKPNMGKSRSRKSRTSARRHCRLAASVRARNESGNPPLTQRRSHCEARISSQSNPERSMYPMRPASDSAVCFSSSGEALPSTRKRAGKGRRSARTRSTGNRSGRLWISSSTIRPRKAPSASSGSPSRAMSCGLSRSKKAACPRNPAATWRARVVFPTCRGPRIPTTRKSLSIRRASVTRSFLATITTR